MMCKYMSANSTITTKHTSGEPSARSGVHERHKLLVAHVQELLQVHAAVRELLEGPPLLQRRDLLCILREGNAAIVEHYSL